MGQVWEVRKKPILSQKIMGKIYSQVLWLQKYFKTIVTVVLTFLVTGVGGALWGGIIEPSTRKANDDKIQRSIELNEIEISKKVDKSVFDVIIENEKKEIKEIKDGQAKQTEMLFEIYKEVKHLK